MFRRRLVPLLALALLALPAPAGAALPEEAVRADGGAGADTQASTAAARLAPGRVIRTRRSWECTGRLRRYGRLPIKVVSNMPNPGNGDAIRLVGCRGDGNRRTVDLILDVNGNGGDRGTAFDGVKVGQDTRDLVVTGDVECGRRHTDPSVHQDTVQVMSGRNIVFRRFTSGSPRRGRWTCWGAGGGWFVAWGNGGIPRNVVCNRCRIATFNQAMRLHDSIRSGARRSIFGFSRSYGIFIGPEARRPVNKRNRVIEY